MTKKTKSTIKWVVGIIAASGVLAVLLTQVFKWWELYSNTPENIVIVLTESFSSYDKINRQRIYLLNHSDAPIINAKIQIKVPDINCVNFRYDVSSHLKFQEKDHSITSGAFIIVFDKIIGKVSDDRTYYIDILWEGNPIGPGSIYFESDNCHEEKKTTVSEFLNNNI